VKERQSRKHERAKAQKRAAFRAFALSCFRDCISRDDVLALHARIKDHVTIRWGPEIYHYGMHEFAIEDCNGYTLSFGQPTDLPATCAAD
jgi:hypothetical protein